MVPRSEEFYRICVHYFLWSRNLKRGRPKPDLGCTATAKKKKITKFCNFNNICREKVRIFINFLNIVESSVSLELPPAVQTYFPTFVVLESRPLVPKYGLPLGGQTSLPSSGEPEGWIYIPSRFWFSKFCLAERRPIVRWLLPRATSNCGQVWSSLYSVVLCNNQWIACSFSHFVFLFNEKLNLYGFDSVYMCKYILFLILKVLLSIFWPIILHSTITHT
jgi:hypothetical protein